jgi:hypothetical protein
MATEHVTVAIDERFRGRFAQVVERIKSAGLKVDQELEEAGVVTGSIVADKLSDLERVEGVAAAERDRQIRIAPPESDVQ